MERHRHQSGFTIVELLVTIAVIAILASVVLAQVTDARDRALFARAQTELRGFATALEQYELDTGEYPTDTPRGVVPVELTPQINDAAFARGPWSTSAYSWDISEIDGETVAQFTLRLCPADASDPEECAFPTRDWADDFDIHSSIFYCITGACRAAHDQPLTYPGYCLNCDCQEMATCE